MELDLSGQQVSANLLSLGCEVILSSPQEFAKLLNDDIELWARAIQVAGVKKGA